MAYYVRSTLVRLSDELRACPAFWVTTRGWKDAPEALLLCMYVSMGFRKEHGTDHYVLRMYVLT